MNEFKNEVRPDSDKSRVDTEKKNLSRRSLLKVFFGGAVTSVFLGSSYTQRDVAHPQNESDISVDADDVVVDSQGVVEAAQETEISSFASLYEEYERFSRHTKIHSKNFDISLREFIVISQHFKKSDFEDLDPQQYPGIAKFTEGWGSSKDQAVDLAQKKVANLHIYPGENMSEDWVRNQYVGKIAQYFPALAMGLPDQLAVAFPPVTTNDIVQTGLINGGGNQIYDWANFTHELTHVGDVYYDRFKSVVELETYVEYKRLNLQFAGEILLELYNKSDLESASQFAADVSKWGEKIVGRVFHGAGANRLLDSIHEVEQALGLDELPETDDRQRYTRAVWELGRMQRNDPDNELFEDEAVQAVRAAATDDILHSLIPYGEDLTGHYTNNLIGSRMKELVEYRLNMFGNEDLGDSPSDVILRRLFEIEK